MTSTLPQRGLIIARFGNRVEVETEDGRILRCHLRQQFSDAVCGDRIHWQASGNDAFVIIDVEERQTVLARVDDRHKVKPLAANVTDLMVVLANKPLPSTLLLDSYLVIAEILHLQAQLICNKTDLFSSDEHQTLNELMQTYASLSYPIHWLSAKEKTGLTELERALVGKTAVFVGQSGVGKSSLISSLLPEITISIGSLSQGIEAGAHTTTTTRLYHLTTGGDVIDSPGIREFGLWHLPKAQIQQGFREITAASHHCKFRNCSHIQEPHCRVIEDVEQGKIIPSRYQNYCKLYLQTD